MAETTATPQGLLGRAAEEAGFCHEAALNAAWTGSRLATLVAVVGAAHGTAFTAYVLLVPLVAWLLRWPLHTTSVALSAAFVPFAPWVFERRVRAEFARHLGDRLVVAAVHAPGPHVTAAGSRTVGA